MENLSSIFLQLSPGPDGWLFSSVAGERKYGKKKKKSDGGIFIPIPLEVIQKTAV